MKPHLLIPLLVVCVGVPLVVLGMYYLCESLPVAEDMRIREKNYIEDQRREAEERRKWLEAKREEERRIREAKEAEERRQREEREAEERRKREEAEAVERRKRKEAEAAERRKKEEADTKTKALTALVGAKRALERADQILDNPANTRNKSKLADAEQLAKEALERGRKYKKYSTEEWDLVMKSAAGIISIIELHRDAIRSDEQIKQMFDSF